MPGIAEINHWNIYRKCLNTNLIIYRSNYKDQVTITESIANTMSDFNATVEIFTELGAREYIISKKVYDILKAMKVNRLKCEPIAIIP